MLQLYTDCRLSGTPRYFLDSEGTRLMVIPPEIRKCVCFIASGPDQTAVRFRGTGFFLAKPITDDANGHYFTYVITARHVIDGIRSKKEQCFLRVNREHDDQGILLEVKIEDWVAHPDRSVDACVLRIPDLPGLGIKKIPVTMTLTDAIIAEEGIGAGEEVFLTGLFVNHFGKRRNVPIVRVGNIAAMPEEKVYSPVFGDMDAYLIECRSIGGLSGSPVFAHLGLVRRKGKAIVHSQQNYGVFFWMGLAQGHYDGKLTTTDEVETDDAKDALERVNMGIAIVVPASRIMEIFEDEDMKKKEAEIIKKEREESAPTLDTANDGAEFSREEFETALKKVSRKLSDEEKSGT